MHTARRFWEAIEPLHAVVHFASEATESTKQLGLRRFWMSYFAGRFAPMGPIPAAAATAMAFGFAPSMVARSIPDAWTFADPAAVLLARIDGAKASLRRHLDPHMLNDVTRLADPL